MNTTNHSPCRLNQAENTRQSNDPNPIRVLSVRAGIFPPGGMNPTLPDAIQAFHEKIQELQKHPSSKQNRWTGDYCMWKEEMDHLQETLQTLQQMATIIPTSPSTQSASLENFTVTEPVTPEDNTNETTSLVPENTCPQQDPLPRSASCDHNALLQPLTETPDAERCGRDAERCDPEAERCDPEAIPSDHDPVTMRNDPEPSIPQLATPVESIPNLYAVTFQPTPLPPVDQGTEFFQNALLLRERLDCRSALDCLSPLQQDAVAHLLTEIHLHQAVDLLAAPAPVGFGLRVSRSSLTRFKKRYEKRQILRDQLKAIQHAAQILKEGRDPDNALLHASERLLKMRLLHATTSAQSSPELIQQLLDPIIALRKQTLAERKQTQLEKQNQNESEPPRPTRHQEPPLLLPTNQTNTKRPFPIINKNCPTLPPQPQIQTTTTTPPSPIKNEKCSMPNAQSPQPQPKPQPHAQTPHLNNPLVPIPISTPNQIPIQIPSSPTPQTAPEKKQANSNT